jgi:hypothetical protein
MLKLVGWLGVIVLFVWATVSAFSIFSKLTFLVDGWTWSVDQVPVTIKAVLLAVGRYVSGIVGGYREFVHGLVAMLHLPKLPQAVYGAVGVAAFSTGRGYWLSRRAQEAFYDDVTAKAIGKDGEVTDKWRSQYDCYTRRHPLFSAKLGVRGSLWGFARPHHRGQWWQFRPGRPLELLIEFIADVLVYGGLVAIIIAALFGIDYVYRHFA